MAWLRSIACSVLAMAMGASAHGGGLVVPTDGMVITRDTTFAPGTYNLPNGISIGAPGVTLHLNGAVLVGAGGTTYGITVLGKNDVSILGAGGVHGYYYGIRAESLSGLTVSGCDCSDNYVDPASLGGGAPFLNINVAPTLPNFTNLGGGIYLRNVSGSSILGNALRSQQNGINLFNVTSTVVSTNDASSNTGWGIHLNGSTGNTISDNVADSCIRAGLGDSAGVLLVNGSSGNQIVGNSFRFCGDGFFIGNENGCPSNDNLIQGNDGSGAGANAFEATFSSGNQFLDNVANGSNYGFWLGYSHDGNLIEGNEIRFNNQSGIEIEHGQNNSIIGNTIVGNGGSAIVLRTDGSAPFPPAQFPCLNLPNQSASSGYVIRDNVIKQNFGRGIFLTNTTSSTVTNNLLGANAGGNAQSNGAGVVWSLAPSAGPNIVDGPTKGGNYWSDYTGQDVDADGLGDTLLPFLAGGAIAAPGDLHPLIGSPDLGGFDNPTTLCARSWLNLGANTRSNGTTFQTANGTHYATDGSDLYLLEGSNGTAFDRFDPAISRYVIRAGVPEGVEDGGDLQFGGSLCYAGVGLSMNASTGAGKGPKLYAYNPATNTWAAKASCVIGGKFLAHEALAYDPASGLLYATITSLQTGADTLLKRKLAIYNTATNAWIGTTSAAPFDWNAGTDAECVDGVIYVWRGGFNGGAVNGSDSSLLTYTIATDTWGATPTLQSSGVAPGFRSGALDVWGVALAADAARGLVFVLGGESNKLVYVYDIANASWRVAANAPYDGGWGDGLEYVPATNRLYVIDGRNIGSTTQGTGVLVPSVADIDRNGSVGATDLALLLGAWGACDEACCPADIDESGEVDATDLAIVLGAWGT